VFIERIRQFHHFEELSVDLIGNVEWQSHFRSHIRNNVILPQMPLRSRTL